MTEELAKTENIQPDNNSKKIERDSLGRLLPGQVLNPTGRPKGSANFNTLYDEAVGELAKANNITPDEVKRDLMKMAIKMAREGNYNFFRDLMDRQYGQARQVIKNEFDDEVSEVKITITKNDIKP